MGRLASYAPAVLVGGRRAGPKARFEREGSSACADESDERAATRGADEIALAPAAGLSRRAFERAVDEHLRSLLGYAARRLGRHVAEDVVSETFTRAWAQRHTFDPARGTPRTWLFGICTNVMHRHVRDELRAYDIAARTGTDPLLDLDEDAIVAGVDAQHSARAVARALRMLSPDHRDVLLLRAWAPMSEAEIAAALGVEPGTVKSRLSRARRQFDTAYASFDGRRPDDAVAEPA